MYSKVQNLNLNIFFGEIMKKVEICLMVSKIIRTFAAVLRHNDFCGKAKEKNFVGLPEKIS